MTRQEIAAFIEEHKIIAVVRLPRGDQLAEVTDALLRGGVRIIEFTLTTPDALEGIAEVSKEGGSATLIGAGSVLDEASAVAAIRAGASFVVSPILKPEVVAAAHRYGKAAMPGGYTPTELAAGTETGADFVKVFPANALGPSYLKAVRGPLPGLRMVPTGGVTVENAAGFLKAGAVALGVGGELVPAAAVEKGDLGEITKRAQAFVDAVKD